MLFLISPAKALDYDTPPTTTRHTQPLFVAQAAQLIDVLRPKAPQDIAALMGLSDQLAGLNAARYQAWVPTFDTHNAKQAVLAFNGDVYEGLNAKTLSEPELAWAQDHVCILSGLYGVLRPLDLMQPYRLEMGTRLATDKRQQPVPVLGQPDCRLFEPARAGRCVARGHQPCQRRILQISCQKGVAAARGDLRV
jgi:cytoplasmic iron level regulating protein YaaA (DUF328/UPF0246 family)